ncbi:hypothetical protein [Actinomadura roseirufa]|nr:hypothetical protein [Actinomadura roseirufa]
MLEDVLVADAARDQNRLIARGGRVARHGLPLRRAGAIGMGA